MSWGTSDLSGGGGGKEGGRKEREGGGVSVCYGPSLL